MPGVRITTINGSDVDNDAYCVCTHDFSLCTHKKLRPVRTMYAVKISGTQTVFGFMRTQIKIPFKFLICYKMTINFQLILSGCSANNRKVVTILIQFFDRSILHIMQYTNILCIFSSYTIYLPSVNFLGQTHCLPKVYSKSLMLVCH